MLLTGFHALWDKILSQNLQAVADQRCHLKGSSPHKGIAYRGFYCSPDSHTLQLKPPRVSSLSPIPPSLPTCGTPDHKGGGYSRLMANYNPLVASVIFLPLDRLKRTLTTDSGIETGEWDDAPDDDADDIIRESAAESLLGLWTVNRAQEQKPNSFSLDLKRLNKVRLKMQQMSDKWNEI
jgi:hypothetical protein